MYNSSHQPYLVHTESFQLHASVLIYLVLIAFSESWRIVTDEAEVFLWQCLLSEANTITMLPAETLLTLGMEGEGGRREMRREIGGKEGER